MEFVYDADWHCRECGYDGYVFERTAKRLALSAQVKEFWNFIGNKSKYHWFERWVCGKCHTPCDPAAVESEDYK